MKYLLRLAVDYVIPTGTVIGDSNDLTTNTAGIFWDGSKITNDLDGGITTKPIYCINWSCLALDERDLFDTIHMDFDDLFECDLVVQWADLTEPIIFLMSIYSYKTGYYNDEWEMEHYSVSVVEDFNGLDKI